LGETCKNFRYSQFTRKNEYEEIVTLPKGFCRRFPPQYAVRGTWGDYNFPLVTDSDWCGEGREKEG
jgi:hypothetical protein